MNFIKPLIYSFILLFCANGLTAQVTNWEITMPWGTTNGVVQTPDGGWAVTGSLNNQITVAKFNSNGIMQWNEEIGNGSCEEADEIINTSDGGLAIAGIIGSCNTYINGGIYVIGNIYIIKLDGSGNVQWANAITTSYAYEVSSIAQSTDGAYFVDGATQSSPWVECISKLSSSGSLLWLHQVNVADSYVSSIAATIDGGCIDVDADSISSGTSQLRLTKFDSLGNVKKCVLYPIPLITNVSHIGLLKNGNYAIAVTCSNGWFHEWGNVSIVDTSFNMVKSLNMEYDSSYEFYDIIGFSITPAGGIAIFAEPTPSYFDAFPQNYFVTLDTGCNVLLSATVYDSDYLRIYGPWIYPTGISASADGSVALTMNCYPGLFIKTDAKGNSCITGPWSIDTSSVGVVSAQSASIPFLPPGGSMYSVGSVLCTSCIPDTIKCNSEYLGDGQFSVFPNPSNGWVNIYVANIVSGEKIEIYSTLGQLVYSRQVTNNLTTTYLNPCDCMYICIIRDGSGKILYKSKVVEL